MLVITSRLLEYSSCSAKTAFPNKLQIFMGGVSCRFPWNSGVGFEV